jgi:hypothetical protein
MKKILLLLLLSCSWAWADRVRDALGQAVAQRFGQRMPYATIVPYKNMFFGSAYNVTADTRNSTGKKTHFAIYEYVGGRWKYIFEFDCGVDADEESARLDALFAKNRFSSEMRAKLMYGPEISL